MRKAEVGPMEEETVETIDIEIEIVEIIIIEINVFYFYLDVNDGKCFNCLSSKHQKKDCPEKPYNIIIKVDQDKDS